MSNELIERNPALVEFNQAILDHLDPGAVYDPSHPFGGLRPVKNPRKSPVYSESCYICRDPDFAKYGLPLCMACPFCGGHIAADDSICDDCQHDIQEAEEYLIWWTNQLEAEAVEVSALSEYVLEQFKSRFGRNGRGRLWVAAHLPVKDIPWNKDKPAVARACDCGGIVIHVTQLEMVKNQPGFITDLWLNFYE